MPVYEYICKTCGKRVEKMLTTVQSQVTQFCDGSNCGDQLDMVPSRPAWFPTGKYGKGGQK